MIKKEFFLYFPFEFILIFLIIFTPLFYGSLLPIPLSILQLTSFFLLFLFLVKLIILPKIFYPSSIIFLVFFIAIVIFQLIPLPLSILKVISPKTAFLYQEYLINNSGQNLFRPLTLYSWATQKEIVNFLSFLSIFLVTINIFKKRSQFERLFLIIIIWAAVLAFYGLMRRYFILGRAVTFSFSTFGNRNHFAGYMVMVVPLSIGYALACQDWAKKFLFWFLGSVIAGAIFLSFSRGGILSLIFSIILLICFTKRDWLKKEKFWLGVILVFFVAVFLFMFGIGPLKEKFANLKDGVLGRWLIVKDSLKIVKDFPFFGVGWGNFSFIFTLYKSFISADIHYNYLHNDPLQLVVETGLVASFLYFIFLYKIFKNIFIRLRQRRDIFVRSLVSGAMSGLFAVIFHSFFEYNFHIPAISFLFWFILGLVYKCVDIHFRDENES